MDAKYLRYTVKEMNNLIKYYIGTPKIYNYCYENSIEFRNFIDNASEKRKKEIKKLHKAYYLINCKGYLANSVIHLSTLGLSFACKKFVENKKNKKLDEEIRSDEFKTLFKNFDEVLRINNIDWCNE